jgi:fatty acid desaturase
MQAEVSYVPKTANCSNRSRLENVCAALLSLRYPADVRSLGFLTALAVLFGIQWTGWMRGWLLLAMTCVFAFVACIIKHNHIHCRTFTNRFCNRAFDHLLGLCTGQPSTAIISIHNERHHAQYHTERDCVRSSLVGFRWNWLNLILFPFAAVRAVHQNKQQDLRRWQKEKPYLYRRLIWERTTVVAFILALLVLDWRSTLVYFGVPWLFGQWGIVTINLLQHQGCDHDSLHDHSRNVTGRFINWLFLNNGFHTAHHLKPSLHWGRLPEFHRRLVEPGIRGELNERSLLVSIWKQFFSRKSPRPTA